MKKIFLISLVIVLSGLVFHSWLSFSIFNIGDWRFAYSENLKEDLFPSAWIHGEQIGFLSAVLWSYPQKLLSGAFGALGFDWNIAEKVIILWPIIILIPISSYLILRKSGFRRLSASIGSMYLIFNSYFLSIATQGHQFLTGAAIWGMLSLYFLMRARDDALAVWAVLAGITLSIAGSYDFRLAYIFLGVGVLYFLWEWWGMVRPHPNPLPEGEGGENPLRPSDTSPSRRGGGVLFRLFGVFVAVFVGLNVFWMLPFGAAGAVGLENAGMGRDLFGNDAFELDDAMYLSHPFWTGYGVKWFSDQATPWWLSVLGVLAWVGFWVGRRNRLVVFFAIISVLGILLGKQVSEPWGNLYYFLYDHLPGFNAFREASKFYILVVLGYAVGIGALVERILANPHLQRTTDNSQRGRGRAGNKVELTTDNSQPTTDNKSKRQTEPNSQQEQTHN